MGKSKTLRGFLGVVTVLLGTCVAGSAFAGVTLSATVVEADPSYVEFSGTGYTDNGSVEVYTYDPTTHVVVNYEYVTATSTGHIPSGAYMYMNCLNDDDLYLYAYDETSGNFTWVYPVRSGCIG